MLKEICIDVKSYSFFPIDSKMYVIENNNELLIIDPHISEEFKRDVEFKKIEKIYIVLTHEHFDHISGVNWFKENYEAVVYASFECSEKIKNNKKNLSKHFNSLMSIAYNIESEELFPPYECISDVTLSNYEQLELINLNLSIYYTPGHSSGSICIVVNDEIIFTGDSLLNGLEVITRFPGGSKKDYEQITLPFLQSLPGDMIVFPGHGEPGTLKELLNEVKS